MSGFIANPWLPEEDERLRALWDENLSTAEIGRRMDRSKNSVVGRSHRLLLSPRPSPIRVAKGDAPRPRRLARAGKVTLPQARVYKFPQGTVVPATETSVGQAVANPPKGHAAAERAATLKQPTPEARVVAATRPAAPPVSPTKTCQWIEGRPRGEHTVFCGDPALMGKSYCPAHATRCFVSVQNRRDPEMPDAPTYRTSMRLLDVGA